LSDFTMCKNNDCGYQDYCWRLNAPPNLHRQAYDHFEPNLDEEGEIDGCDFFMEFPKL
jgi:hypothetical protein